MNSGALPTAKPGRSIGDWLNAHGINARTVLLIGPAVLVMLLLFAYPTLYGLQLSMHSKDGDLFGNYQRFFADSYEASTIWKTLRLAAPAALLNVLVSIPIAYKMRLPFRLKQATLAILLMPITLGNVFVAQGLVRFFGPHGWFNRVLVEFGVISAPLDLVYNYISVFATLVISGFPFALLIILAYASGIDSNLDRAGAMLGARPARRFWKIALPLMLPGVTVAFMLVFVVAFAVFPSAVMVGQPADETRVISIAAYQAAFERFDFPMASAIATIMAVVQICVLAAVFLFRSRLYRGPSSTGKG